MTAIANQGLVPLSYMTGSMPLPTCTLALLLHLSGDCLGNACEARYCQ